MLPHVSFFYHFWCNHPKLPHWHWTRKKMRAIMSPSAYSFSLETQESPMFVSVAVLAYTACRSLLPLRLSGAALPRSRSSSFTSSPLAILRAFRVRPRLLPARSKRECHPPESPLFSPLRLLHLWTRLPNHDIDFNDVNKCTYLYRQLPSTTLSPLTENALNVAKCGSLRSVVVSSRRSSVVGRRPSAPPTTNTQMWWVGMSCPSTVHRPPSTVCPNGLLRRIPL